jgi:hypothetical protein
MEDTEPYQERLIAARGHALMTPKLRLALPPLYSTEDDDDARAIVRYFSPYSNWVWYAFEFSPEDDLFFGFVIGFEAEWGYFGLAELDCAKGGLPLVERDLAPGSLPTKGELSAATRRGGV